MEPYMKCPVIKTEDFILRLVSLSDADGLFACYNDSEAVRFMNDDNCDFGFFTGSKEKMEQTIGYWLDFYKKKCFIRFSIVDRRFGLAVGTIEGFGGETGVLRVDIASRYEKEAYLRELFRFAKEHFYQLFGNRFIVTKAISEARERKQALLQEGYEFIGTFRGFPDYYRGRTIE